MVLYICGLPITGRNVLLDCLELGHGSSSDLRLILKHQLFLGVEQAGMWPGTDTTGSSQSQAFRLRLEPNYPLCSPGLQLANCRPWDFSASIIL